MITTPQQFKDKHNPTVERLSDEELERRINLAVDKARPGFPIYVDCDGRDSSGLPLRNNPNRTRARELAEAAGWQTSEDGRTGRLVLEAR